MGEAEGGEGEGEGEGEEEDARASTEAEEVRQCWWCLQAGASARQVLIATKQFPWVGKGEHQRQKAVGEGLELKENKRRG